MIKFQAIQHIPPLMYFRPEAILFFIKNNIEIEIGSSISEKEYKKLLLYFQKNAELTKEDTQETIYYDCPQDLSFIKFSSYTLWRE